MTIYALSSGPGISGLAVIRVSGPDTKRVISRLTNIDNPKNRIATLTKFFNKKKDVKAKIERQIKNINKIFSDFEALTVLIIKYFYLF